MGGYSQECLVLGIDLDEVCADFVGGFNRRAYEVLGEDVIRTDKNYRWPCWAIVDALSITPEQEQIVWNDISDRGGFWQNLDPLPGAKDALLTLQYMEQAGDVRLVFLTARPEVSGNGTYLETLRWLKHRVGVDYPYVVIAHDKGPVAKALGFTHFVDDKFQNIEAVRDAGVHRTFFVRHPHGEQYVPYVSGNTTIINNLDDFVTEVVRDIHCPKGDAV
jgi:5' nucleotidase, deoxy (Pyrimidine), cytosolic type C protein (NT5C)